MIAYIAGPYRSKWGKLGIVLNAYRAWKVAREVWRMGIPAICPHTNALLMDGEDELYLRGDIEMLKKCDMIVLQGVWETSDGSVNERKVAKQKGMLEFNWNNSADKEQLKILSNAIRGIR